MRALRQFKLLTFACAVSLLPVAAVDIAPATAAAVFPSNGTIIAISSHTFTVQLRATHGARSYIVSASTDRTQMSVAKLRADTHNLHHFRTASRSLKVTVNIKHFTQKPLYYRVAAVEASNGHVAWSTSFSAPFGLRPSAPTALKRHSGRDGEYLAWTSTSNGSYIQQATNKAFTTGVKVYRTRGTTHRFTPYGLTVGHTYWFRVRASNVHTYSTPSAPVSLVAAAHEQSIRVMSYNLLGANLDGEHEGGQVVASWSTRVKGAAALVERGKPDVLAVQEAFPILGPVASDYPTKSTYPNWKIPASDPCNALHYSDPRHYPYRQVDSLCDALGNGKVYRRAVDGTADHNGSGNYLIYNYATTALVGHGGFWSIGYTRTAGWQEFESRASKVKYLVVTPHTTPAAGAVSNTHRTAEVHSLITQAKREAAALHISEIIYAGDFNTYPGLVGVADSTTPIMAANFYNEAFPQAQLLSNAQYNSSNGDRRVALNGSNDIDHIFVTHGMGVKRFGEEVNISHGKYVGTMPSDHNPIYADLTLPY